MKVLLVAGIDHGIYTFLRALIAGMQAEGWQVDCAAGLSGYKEKLEAMGCRVFPLPYGKASSVFTNLSRINRLVKLIRREKYAVINTHNPLAAFTGRIAAAIARAPVVTYTVHGFSFHEDAHPLKQILSVLAERLAGRITTFSFYQSSEDHAYAIKGGIAAPEKTMLIRNGIDPEVFNPANYSAPQKVEARRELGLPEDGPIVGMVARFSYEKGIREFIEAAGIVGKVFPDSRFLLIGGQIGEGSSQPHSSELRNLAAKHGAEGQFVATEYRNDVPRLLACCDVFCLPSYHEGLPRSIIEAMSMELPVVATDIRGCREEVIEGETGFLIPVRDSKALAEKVLVLLRDKEMAQRFGKRARELVLEQYVEKDIIQMQVDVMKLLLAAIPVEFAES